jgi:lysophospholipase L1-like esterase
LGLALLIGYCAIAHWLVYAGYKRYAADVLLQPLAASSRLDVNHALRIAVALFAGLSGLRVLLQQRFGGAWTSARSQAGRVATALAWSALLAASYRNAGADVVAVLSLAGAAVLAGVFAFTLTSALHVELARRWKQLALALASLVISFEVGLRVLLALSDPGALADLGRDPRLPAPGSEVELGALLMPSAAPDVIYQLKPGLDVRFKGARVTTNSLGWRDGEHAVSKPEGVVRILGLGDSVMFGWGVDAQARYLNRLEVALTKKYPEVEWEAAVSAVPGYNLAMAVAALRADGMAYEPDLIVYGFVGNDAALPNFLQERVSPASMRSFILFYAELMWTRSASLLTRDFVGRPVGGPVYAVQDPALAPPEYRGMLGPEGFLRAFDALVTLAGDAPVVTLSFEGERGLIDASGRGSARYLDVSKARRRLGAAFNLSANDPHPSEAGHALLGDALFEHLEAHGLSAALVDAARGGGSKRAD